MELRLAKMDDLLELKAVYKKIIEKMDSDNIKIWDDIFPCEFFAEDIENNCLYVLEESDEIVSAFSLSNSNEGADFVEWENKHDSALYIGKLGVNVDYLKKGIGSLTLKRAISLARDKGAKYLRLFVVDRNEPAINLYIKNGFKKVQGFYDEVIDEHIVLREYGFEIKTSI